MGVTAIGASVKRTEDIRFVTGKGHYVDDVNRPGQAYAYFLRSPHAHATIDKIDTSAALKSPGVVAILTGDDIAADKVGGLGCGWMIYSKDGSPMKAVSHSRSSPEQGPLRRRQRRRRHCRHLRSGARRGGKDHNRIRRVAGRRRYGDHRQPRPAATARRCAEQHRRSTGNLATRRRPTRHSHRPPT